MKNIDEKEKKLKDTLKKLRDINTQDNEELKKVLMEKLGVSEEEVEKIIAKAKAENRNVQEALLAKVLEETTNLSKEEIEQVVKETKIIEKETIELAKKLAGATSAEEVRKKNRIFFFKSVNQEFTIGKFGNSLVGN